MAPVSIEMSAKAVPMDDTDAEYGDADSAGFDDEFASNIGAMPASFRPLHSESSSCRRRGCLAVSMVMIVAVAAVYYGMTEYGNADLIGLHTDGDEGVIDQDPAPAPAPTNPHLHGHWIDHVNASDYHQNEEYYIFGKKHNRTEDAINAYQDRWKRAHPGKEFPGFHKFHGKGIDALGGNHKLCVENIRKNREWFKSKITLKNGTKYEVLETLDHDPQAFTQGLTWADGVLYESTGLYGESTVRILDPKTAEVKKKVKIPDIKFGEGMTYYKKDQLIQLTWKRRPLTGYIYNATTLDLIKEFEFSTTKDQGWGVTWDECHNRLYVTDGSEYLHVWDPDTLEELKKVRVQRQSGKPAIQLNEIEFWRNRVLANVWFEDVILVINPLTGEVEKEYDFSKLWPRSERNPHADVLNGISISEDPDVLYITGKMWGKMFKVKLE